MRQYGMIVEREDVDARGLKVGDEVKVHPMRYKKGEPDCGSVGIINYKFTGGRDENSGYDFCVEFPNGKESAYLVEELALVRTKEQIRWANREVKNV